MLILTDRPCFSWLTQPVAFTSTQTHTLLTPVSVLRPPGKSESGQQEPSVPPPLFLKGSTGLQGRIFLFFFWYFFSPKPFCVSSSWAHTHTLELSTAFRSLMSMLPQLLTQRAGPLSQTQSCYCPSSMEALAAHNTEQLTNWEQPCRFRLCVHGEAKKKRF